VQTTARVDQKAPLTFWCILNQQNSVDLRWSPARRNKYPPHEI